MTQKYTLESNKLIIQVKANGAELCSVISKENNQEFMWQANPDVWNRHAPVLFPVVGKLNADTLHADGKDYTMGQHGFARDMNFEATEIYEDVLRFMIESNDVSLNKYPYQFRFFISYTLKENHLLVTYTTLNTDNKTMYFSVGAHPGFLLPVPRLDEYILEWDTEENLERELLQNGLFSGRKEMLAEHTKQLPLSKELFLKDALVFHQLKSRNIVLKHTRSNFEVGLTLHNFPWLGIWTKPGQESFLCIEPWQGRADDIGYNGDISQKTGILSLEPGQESSFSYTISFTATSF